jgi:hypothetical protein
MMWLLAAALALGAPSQAGSAGRVDVRATLERDTARIGEHVVLTVSVLGVPDNADVVFPILPDSGDLVALGIPRMVESENPAIRSARYELVAWNDGVLELPRGNVLVTMDGTELAVPLPDVTVHIASVLPEDANPDTLAWRPAADVVGANWSLQEKLAAAGLLVGLLLAAFLHVRRLGRSTPVPVPSALPARDKALAALDVLERCGLAEAGEMKGFFSALSQILRQFLADTERVWGLDLTTLQLMAVVSEDGIEEADLHTLELLLTEADLVKFARFRPSSADADAALNAARLWIDGFERIAPEPEAEAEELESRAEAEDADAAFEELERIFAEAAEDDGEEEAKG